MAPISVKTTVPQKILLADTMRTEDMAPSLKNG
jgi:hypothetical protein